MLLTFVLIGGADKGGLIALEDGPAEYLQATFYAAGMIASIWAWTRGFNRLAACVWAVLCFMFFGEETSWLQRVFDYSVPAIEQANGQREFNFHNLKLFGSGRLLNKDGSLSLDISAFMNSQNLFRLGFFIYFLALPALSVFRPLGQLLKRIGYVALPLQLLAVVWPFIILTFVFSAVNVEPMKFYLAEVRETVYAATIFIYCLTICAAGRAGRLAESLTNKS